MKVSSTASRFISSADSGIDEHRNTGGSVGEHRAVWLDFQVFSDKDYKPEVPSYNLKITVGR